MIKLGDLLNVVGAQVDDAESVFLADGAEADQTLDPIVREDELLEALERSKSIDTGKKVGCRGSAGEEGEV